jgi:hypothetical protein
MLPGKLRKTVLIPKVKYIQNIEKIRSLGPGGLSGQKEQKEFSG